MQADLESKYEDILSSELAKLGEESREVEERRSTARLLFAQEETSLRQALEAKREEREEANKEVSCPMLILSVNQDPFFTAREAVCCVGKV